MTEWSFIFNAIMRVTFIHMYIFLLALNLPLFGQQKKDVYHIRINQVGYVPGDYKCGIAFADRPVRGTFDLIEKSSGSSVLQIKSQRVEAEGWGRFGYYYKLDFTDVRQPGRYYLKARKGESQSKEFSISDEAYDHQQEVLLEFMRQQRCGYNPFLDTVCHQRDGRSAYGPLADSTYVDVSGGWHDAGDQLKYLITGSYATAHMILAYELYPDKFADHVNALGQSGSNGVPDVLDEARWGLDWIHKLHPEPDVLIHQVADDRDHMGWKIPDQDPSDYGWGKNSYRVAYVATGSPQGLNKYQSQATGVANLAGRSAAAMALAARIWKDSLKDPAYAAKCLKAARSLYQMGKEKEGYQQGNSFGAPYRYGEETWADDMEWGAAELYKTTGDPVYLEDAKRYARLAGTVSWMPFDTAAHYQYYPFINMGHFALHGVVQDEFRDTLEAYYQSGIESCLNRASQNPFKIGIPFIWCSNNLLSSLITQVILYEKMSGNTTYHPFLVEQRDWLFGRNPWSTTMFTGIPEGGEYPVDVHTSIWALTGKEVPGGLVDGPVYGTIFRSLKGLEMNHTDEFAQLQNDYVVYHDDIGDYSTNEPTMDGTAGAILMMAHWASH